MGALTLGPTLEIGAGTGTNAIWMAERGIDVLGVDCRRERGIKQAIELNPDNKDARGYYSWFLPIMDRGAEAVAEAKRGLQTDPLSTGLNGNLGSVFVFTHQWDKAIEQLRSSIDLDPNYWFDHYYLAGRMSKRGDCPRRLQRSARDIA